MASQSAHSVNSKRRRLSQKTRQLRGLLPKADLWPLRAHSGAETGPVAIVLNHVFSFTERRLTSLVLVPVLCSLGHFQMLSLTGLESMAQTSINEHRKQLKTSSNPQGRQIP